MTNYITDPIPDHTIAVTRNAERAFSIQKLDPDTNDPTAFNPTDTLTLWVELDRDNPTQIPATINGSIASFVIPTTVTKAVKATTTWQIVLNENTKVPLLVGVFDRNDGRG